jgi:hypothetical protein
VCALVTVVLAFENPIVLGGGRVGDRRRRAVRRGRPGTAPALRALGADRRARRPARAGARARRATPGAWPMRRCRPGATSRPGAAERLQIVRAVATGALDRALDVAATLEVRGYAMPAAAGRASRPPRRRAACGLVTHFHGGEFAGRVRTAGLDTREHGPAAISAVTAAVPYSLIAIG